MSYALCDKFLLFYLFSATEKNESDCFKKKWNLTNDDK